MSRRRLTKVDATGSPTEIPYEMNIDLQVKTATRHSSGGAARQAAAVRGRAQALATGYRAGAVPRLSTAQVLSPSAPRQVASLSQPCLDSVSGCVQSLSYGSGLRRLTRHTPLPPPLRAEVDWRGAGELLWRNLRWHSSACSRDILTLHFTFFPPPLRTEAG